MSFKEFDLSDYIEALENFKSNNTDDIIQHWGSIENFDLFIEKIKEDESKVAKLAIKEYGSVEKYVEAMKYNLEHFSEIMEKQLSKDTKKVVQKNNELYQKLTANMEKDATSDEIQQIVQEIIHFTTENAPCMSLGENYWHIILDSYSNDYVKNITDSKYGANASNYILKAFDYYLKHNTIESK